MKKLSLTTITVFTVMFLLASCGSGGDSKNDENNQTTDENQNQSTAVCSYGEYECHGDDSYFCGYPDSSDDVMWMLSESCTNGCDTSTGKCNSGSNGNNDNPNENNNQNEDENSDTEWEPEEDYNDEENGNNGGGSIFEPCEEGDFICHSADGNEFSYKCDKYTLTPVVLEQCGDDCDSSTGKCKPWKDPDSKLVWSSKRSEEILWDDAVSYCENLDEGGHSDWRLPTICELRSLIQNCPETEIDGSCGITDDCLNLTECLNTDCIACNNNGGHDYSKFGDLYGFWSSSEAEFPAGGSMKYVYSVNFTYGSVGQDTPSVMNYVRCVRNAD